MERQSRPMSENDGKEPIKIFPESRKKEKEKKDRKGRGRTETDNNAHFKRLQHLLTKKLHPLDGNEKPGLMIFARGLRLLHFKREEKKKQMLLDPDL